jgi:hypothetical protein
LGEGEEWRRENPEPPKYALALVVLSTCDTSSPKAAGGGSKRPEGKPQKKRRYQDSVNTKKLARRKGEPNASRVIGETETVAGGLREALRTSQRCIFTAGEAQATYIWLLKAAGAGRRTRTR